MRKTKLFHQIQKLTTSEKLHFKKFINSPFFNRRKDLILLYDLLLKRQKGNLSKTAIFSKLYPNEEFDERKMNLTISYLFKCVEQFLVYCEISKNKSLMKLNLAKVYRQKQDVKAFQNALKQGRKILQKQPIRDRQFLRQVYDFEFEYYDYIGSKFRSEENNLQELADAFDVMYISEKLKQFCFQVSHQSHYSVPYKVGLRKSIFRLLKKEKSLLQHPSIHIYFLCYKATTTGKEKYFQLLRKTMITHGDKFTNSELRDIHLAALNFCINRMNLGESEYVREGFELYRNGLEVGFLLEKGIISRFSFNNIVIIGIKLKEFDWVENFIETYKNKLPKKLRKSVYQYQISILRYEQKRYDEAMEMLSTFDSKDYLMNLGAKFILAKIYYELKEFDPLNSLTDTMRVSLDRNETLGDFYRDHYKMVFSLTKRLLNLKPTKKDKAKLLKDVMELKAESVRDWFLIQLEKV